MGWRMAALVACLAAASSLRAGLDRAKAEPNLGRRSELALANAEDVLQAAREAYRKGDNGRVAAAAEEIRESVELAGASLDETGKNPRKSPKWFKKAEIETRLLLRKLDSFQQEMGYAERPVLDKVKAATQKVHDELLVGLMEGKRR